MLKKEQFFICYLNILAAMGISIIAPLFPPMCKEKQISNEICSYIIAILSLSQIITSIFSPIILEKFGKKNIFYSSLIFQTLITFCYGLMYYIKSNFIFILTGFILRIIHGFCGCMINIICFAMTSLINTNSVELEEAIGYMELSWMIGLTIGPTIVSIFYAIGGYSLPFFFSGLLTSTSIYIYYKIPDIEAPKNTYIIVDKDSVPIEKNKVLLSLYKYPQIFFLTWAVIIETNSIGFYLPTLVNYLKDTWNIGTSYASLFFIMSTVGYTLILQFINIFTNFFGNFPLISLGHICGGISCFITAPIFFLPHSYWTVIIGIFCQGICSCFINIPIFLELNNFMEYLFPNNKNKRDNLASAFFNFSFYFSDFISPIYGSWITTNYNFETSAYVSGCLNFCFIICFIWFYRDRIKQFFNRKKANYNDDDNEKLCSIQSTELI